MLGVSQGYALGRKLSSLIHLSQEMCQRLETTTQTGRAFTIREEEIKNRVGEVGVFEIHISPIYAPEGGVAAVSLLLRDLSPIKKMEEELLHSDRLAVIGTIASGLAHEIRNPLGGIKGAAQMLAREIDQEDLREYLQIIIRESERVNRLISDLLDLAKPKKIRMGSVNLNKLLDEIMTLEKKNESASRISFVRRFDPSLPKVRGDTDQLKQAFLNLIRNAREAISGKGSVQILTRVVTDYQFKPLKGRTSPMVGVEITDTGCGMSDEVLSHLFSPFYTQKQEGTGLGLSICHRIISEHQGTIHIESTPKKGSTFKVYLRAV